MQGQCALLLRGGREPRPWRRSGPRFISPFRRVPFPVCVVSDLALPLGYWLAGSETVCRLRGPSRCRRPGRESSTPRCGRTHMGMGWKLCIGFSEVVRHD